MYGEGLARTILISSHLKQMPGFGRRLSSLEPAQQPPSSSSLLIVHRGPDSVCRDWKHMFTPVFQLQSIDSLLEYYPTQRKLSRHDPDLTQDYGATHARGSRRHASSSSLRCLHAPLQDGLGDAWLLTSSSEPNTLLPRASRAESSSPPAPWSGSYPSSRPSP